MSATPGQLYQWLTQAVAGGGSARSLYSQDTTLSRRGLLTRADRRARELDGLGVGPGHLVVLSMGNVPEFVVLMLAVSKLGAVVVPLDAAYGDRTLRDAADRMPVSTVVRRPRGMETSPVEYPDDYDIKSRKRLAGSLLTVDVLDPPDKPFAIPSDTELLLEAHGAGTVVDIARNGVQLEAIGRAAVEALDLDEARKILCAEPMTSPRYFDPVVLGFLASSSQLVMAEGPILQSVLPVLHDHRDPVVVDSVGQFMELARSFKASRTTAPLLPIIPQATVGLASGKGMKQAFTRPPRQLLQLEEIGVLAARTMERGQTFVPVADVALEPGDEIDGGGHEVLARSPQAGTLVRGVGDTEPGARTGDGAILTGYVGRFNRSGELTDVIGRTDGLVNLEGRRACLDTIEDAMIEHRRLTWVRAELEHTPDGDPHVRLEYRATGASEVEDIEEHAVGCLPPFMVPRAFSRLADA